MDMTEEQAKAVLKGLFGVSNYYPHLLEWAKEYASKINEAIETLEENHDDDAAA